MSECFGLRKGRCEVAKREKLRALSKVCGTKGCPLYKPAGEENNLCRMAYELKPYSREVKEKVKNMPGIGEYGGGLNG